MYTDQKFTDLKVLKNLLFINCPYYEKATPDSKSCKAFEKCNNIRQKLIIEGKCINCPNYEKATPDGKSCKVFEKCNNIRQELKQSNGKTFCDHSVFGDPAKTMIKQCFCERCLYNSGTEIKQIKLISPQLSSVYESNSAGKCIEDNPST